MKKCLGVLLGLALAVPAFAADNVPAQIEAARQAYQRGDLSRAAHELDLALAEVQTRLGKALSESMPPAMAGWQMDAPEVQSLGAAGGGLSVTRAYAKNDASLNASLIIDSPAVQAAAALLSNPAATAAQPNMKRVKVGAEDALMRWDASTKTGEITMVLGTRVLLEISGDNLGNGETLMESAKGWNIAAIRKTVGI